MVCFVPLGYEYMLLGLIIDNTCIIYGFKRVTGIVAYNIIDDSNSVHAERLLALAQNRWNR